jgi:outer membrane protein OmpA-like peptidoglycan-associated protein
MKEIDAFCGLNLSFGCEVALPETASSSTLASLTGNEIQIRSPIQFAAGSDRILDASMPVLDGVEGVLRAHPEIDQLIVEGHASTDGEAEPNYELSARRARAVWEALIGRGIPADRMSYRGAGEARPVVPESTKGAAEINRRVEFHAVYAVGSVASLPNAPTTLPWGAPLPPPRATVTRTVAKGAAGSSNGSSARPGPAGKGNVAKAAAKGGQGKKSGK